MSEVQQARKALEQSILEAIRGFEDQFPGHQVATVFLDHAQAIERCGTTQGVKVEVRL